METPEPIFENRQYTVKKGWGKEIWFHNCEKYCGKLLCVEEGKKCSWHFHLLKTETFSIGKGTIKLLVGWDDDKSKSQEFVLKKGDSYDVPIGLRHQFMAIDGDAEIYEFSTQHFDSDSYRVEKGD